MQYVNPQDMKTRPKKSCASFSFCVINRNSSLTHWPRSEPNMETIERLSNMGPFIGLAGFLFALSTYYRILKRPTGNAKMQAIAQLIESGSMTFLKKEYTALAGLLVVVTALVASFLGTNTAICYLAGAFSSMLCGFIGMKAATKANVRTAQAASLGGKKGESGALSVAFYGGSVMGMSVASLGLLGLGLLYKWLVGLDAVEALNGFAMGASSIALFARVGGGIYTKAADVGADLVGKVEAGIPEDDPRNPAVIADNVGDNVGDTAGMGADIFESYVGCVVATMFIGLNYPHIPGVVYLPLVIVGLGLVASVLGILGLEALKGIGPAWALRLAPVVAPGSSLWRLLCHYFCHGLSWVPLRPWAPFTPWPRAHWWAFSSDSPRNITRPLSLAP